tara:strand:+ start:173 stop:442 length:270 start_codon:yes stop_codon:yes gene_type:complete
METNLVLSLSSIVGLIGLFFTWHKEQKHTSSEVSVLKNKVENLEEKLKVQDEAIIKVQETLMKMDLKLTRIDTQLSLLLEEKKIQKNVN